MKVNICDICYRQDNKASYGHYIATIKINAHKLTLDTCEKHKEIFKNKSFEEAEKIVSEIYHNPTKRIDLIF